MYFPFKIISGLLKHQMNYISVKIPVLPGKISMIVVVLLFLVGMFIIQYKNLRDLFNYFSRSKKANSLVILQHSHYLKLLDLTTYQLTLILNDITSAKLFSRYLIAKRLNTDVKTKLKNFFFYNFFLHLEFNYN